MDKNCNDLLFELLEYCRLRDRVCPLPPQWNRLWEMLPENKINDGRRFPPAPLILAAWGESPLSKIFRLKEHIEWAAQYGKLPEVNQFLRSLPEEHWFHFDD